LLPFALLAFTQFERVALLRVVGMDLVPSRLLYVPATNARVSPLKQANLAQQRQRVADGFRGFGVSYFRDVLLSECTGDAKPALAISTKTVAEKHQ
jgi:hypothetical protein